MWDVAQDYDSATRCFTDDLPYWERLVERHKPTSILELACGTGRISLPLIAAAARQAPSLRFVGLDLSPSFIETIRDRYARAKSLGVSARFEVGDMRAFDFEERFDLIILGYNTLAFLHSVDDQLECFASVRRSLSPVGRFAIDLYTPDYPLLAQARQPYPILRQDVTCEHSADGVQRFASSYVSHYDSASQTESSTHYWDFYLDDGGHAKRFHDLEWHTFFPRELELLLRMSGLTIEHKFGNYRESPFDGDSAQYLWVMKAE